MREVEHRGRTPPQIRIKDCLVSVGQAQGRGGASIKKSGEVTHKTLDWERRSSEKRELRRPFRGEESRKNRGMRKLRHGCSMHQG